ncbi:MAG: hypothetical protein ABWZ40_11630 [Caulobacterales bacterium]
MQTAISPAAIGRDLLNRARQILISARQIGTDAMHAALPRLFDAILFVIAIPRRLRFAFTDYAATKQAQPLAPAAQAMPAADYTPAQAAPVQPAPVYAAAPQAAPAIVFTPEAKGIVALSRENPKLAIIIACLIMGAVQAGIFALTVFMLRDAGYSSGWGDATKYYINCESSAAQQKWGQ